MILRYLLCLLFALSSTVSGDDRLRLIVETDAGGDPDDEQSLVRLLVYANEFEIEGIIANRAVAREKENRNPVRDGLGIVRAMVRAYGECHANLAKHDPRFPSADHLLARTVAGYADTEDGVNLIIRAVDAPDPRPVWFSNWGTDHGSAESCLKRALDRVLRERGPDGYAKFKSRLRLCSADKFGDHTAKIAPPFPIFIFASQPELEGKRWYHRFSAITAKAGGFNLERDVRTGHGPLGALYPTNTNMPQKEGDSMYFLYLLPAGLSDPMQPTWGSWGGRYGPHDGYPGKPYYWANVEDTWDGIRSRDRVLERWAAALQRDFATRMDWCVVGSYHKVNHPPTVVLNGDRTHKIVFLTAKTGETVKLDLAGSTDPEGRKLEAFWIPYPEAGTFGREISLSDRKGMATQFVAPMVSEEKTIHVVAAVSTALTAEDRAPLWAYRRAVVTVKP